MSKIKYIIIFLFILYLLQLQIRTQENFVDPKDLICGDKTETCIKNNIKLDGYCYYPEKKMMVSRSCMRTVNPKCKKIKIGNDEYFLSMKEKDTNCSNLKDITVAPQTTTPVPEITESPEEILKKRITKYKRLLKELEALENYIVNESGENTPEQNIQEERYKKRKIKEKKKEIKKLENILKDNLYDFKKHNDTKAKKVKKVKEEKKVNREVLSLSVDLQKQKQLDEFKKIKEKIEEKKKKEEAESTVNKCINLNKRDGLSDAQLIKEIPYLTDNDLKNMEQIQKDIIHKCKPCPKCPKQKTIKDFDITDHPHFKYFTLKSEKCQRCKTECIDGTKRCPVCPHAFPNPGVSIYDSKYRTNIGSIVQEKF